jgi:hypothetical protein
MHSPVDRSEGGAEEKVDGEPGKPSSGEKTPEDSSPGDSRAEKEPAARPGAPAVPAVPAAPPPPALVPVRATRAGVVQDLFIFQEQVLRVGDPVADLLDSSQLLATVPLPAAMREGYVAGMPAVITSPFFPGEIYGATVRAAGKDASDETVPVELLVTSRMGQLYVGLPVTAFLKVRPQRAALFIPSRAVFERHDEPEVYVVGPGDRIELRHVEIGPEAGGIVRVMKGLAEGERVVLDGSLYLADGDPVAVRSEDEEFTPDSPGEGPAHWAAGGG